MRVSAKRSPGRHAARPVATRRADASRRPAARQVRHAAPARPARTANPPAPPAAPKGRDAARAPRPHAEALDGLRALCVAGVVLYHMGVPWCQGGLLGVTVLFVLSGYLATYGICRAFDADGSVSVGRYYLGRLRRLLPSCVVFVAVTLAAMTAFDHVLLTKMRPDVAPALLMVINWTKILANESYFAAAGSPSPLTHFWSLAIEFQFYLLWAPVLAVLLRRGVRRERVALGLVVAALASAVLMAVLYVPGADPTRAYYGTDTRVQSLFLGSALALVLPLERGRDLVMEGDGTSHRAAVTVVSAASVAALLAMMGVTRGYTSFSYYGGILLVGVLSVLAVATLMTQETPLARLLSARPLRWLGERSFAVYLWHYPVVELLDPASSTAPPSLLRYALEIAVTLVLAELSLRLVEEPCRREGVGRWLAGRAAAVRETAGGGGPHGRLGLVVPALCAVVLAVAVGGSLLVPPVSAAGGQLDDARVSQASLQRPLVDGVYDVVVVGDSVTLNAYAEISAAFPHGVVDGQVSRQASQALAVFEGYRDRGVAGDVVVFAVGTNGALTQDLLEQVVAAVGPDRELYLVNNRAPVDWVEGNNRLIQECADAHDNVHVVDWYGASQGHDDWFEADGTHPVQAGRDAYAQLMLQATGYEEPTAENTRYEALVIGDDVALSAADELAATFPGGAVDAAAGRTPADFPDVYATYEEQGVVGDDVVLCMGSQAPLTRDEVERAVDAVGEDRRVWLVGVRVPEAWAADNNAVLARVASERDNVRLVDWYGESEGAEGYLEADGIHLSDRGAAAYAELVSSALAAEGGAQQA